MGVEWGSSYIKRRRKNLKPKTESADSVSERRSEADTQQNDKGYEDLAVSGVSEATRYMRMGPRKPNAVDPTDVVIKRVNPSDQASAKD